MTRVWYWLKAFTEGQGVKDKLILLPGTILRFASHLFLLFKIPWLPQLLSIAEKPLTNIVVCNRDGLFYCRKGTDDATMAVEAFEFPLRNYFETFNKGIFVDIGANIGKYTIKVGRQIGGEGRVISIEPEPKSFGVLKLNIQLNKLTNVTALNIACWNKEGELELYTAPFPKTSGEHSIKEKVSPQFVKVRCAKLDDILNHIGVEKVAFIKIDVEGAEAEVLEGAQEIIAKSDSLEILFEISNKKNLEKCLEILEGNKMVIKHIWQGMFLAHLSNR